MPAFPKNVKPKCNYENVKYSRKKKFSAQVTVFSCFVNEKKRNEFHFKINEIRKENNQRKKEEINNGSNFIHFICPVLFIAEISVFINDIRLVNFRLFYFCLRQFQEN